MIQDLEGNISDELEEKVWVYQLPDIVVNYHTHSYCVSYKKFNSSDIYMCTNEMEGHDLRKSSWKARINKKDGDVEEHLAEFMPKT